MAAPADGNIEARNLDRFEAICVDLDGTLVATDTGVESLLLFVRKFPWKILLLPLWLLRGRACCKRKLSEAVELPVEGLPYHADLIAWLEGERRRGTKIVLATGSDERIARRVAGHVGVFDEVHASDGETNLTGREKARLLAQRFGRFAYAGNERKDLAVWQASAFAVVAGPEHLWREVQKSGRDGRWMPFPSRGPLRSWVRAFRVHHWVKNVLVFLPLLTSHRLGDWELVRQAVLGFFAFSLAASAVYVWNDLLDLPADRQHAVNRRRPFASGELSPLAGMVVGVLLALMAAVLAWQLPPQARGMLAAYLVLAAGYSLALKRLLFLDVILLVVFYLVRILFGGMVTGIRISIWLLAFSLFLFLCLALLKRLTELRSVAEGMGTAPHRGYRASDAGLIASMGGAAGYLSVLLLALYIHSPEAALLYRNVDYLWPMCLLLVYWVSRATLIANRGELPSDPLVFAFKDRASLVCGAGVLVLLLLAR